MPVSWASKGCRSRAGLGVRRRADELAWTIIHRDRSRSVSCHRARHIHAVEDAPRPASVLNMITIAHQFWCARLVGRQHRYFYSPLLFEPSATLCNLTRSRSDFDMTDDSPADARRRMLTVRGLTV